MNLCKITGAFLLVVLISQSLTAIGQSSKVRFTSDPALSPDGDTIVFTYDKDLWQVPADGGQAIRLTGMEGKENHAAVSPDGRWLAFSSNQYGSRDVYVMPLEGGAIRRLTYHQAADKVESWDWNSQAIYFRSDRRNRMSVYRVSVKGGTPERLFGNYHNTVHNLIPHPKDEIFYFNESWESSIFSHRKHYRGPFNPDIKSYNVSDSTYTKHTHWKGKDFWPMIDRSATLYFVSDQANGEYNLYRFKDKKKQQLTSFDTSVRNPAISADGSRVVFEKEYRLYTYNTAKDTAHPVPISIYKNNTLAKSKGFNTEDEIEAFDVAPDEKKIAFVSRGELFVSGMEGKFIEQLETPVAGRVKEVKWLAGSDSLIFSQTTNGYANWFMASAEGKGTPRQITDSEQNNRMLSLNSDRSKGVYLSGRNELVLINLNSMTTKVIARDEFWGLHNEQPRFAPDDRHILFAARRNFEQDLFVYDLKKETRINLMETGVSENDPFWSPDGKYIYFSSSRTRPSFPRGGGSKDIYRMALQPMDDPYRSEHFQKLFEKSMKKEKEKSKRENDQKDVKRDENNKRKEPLEDVDIDIRKKGLLQRLEQIGPHFGSQEGPLVIQEKGKTFLFYESNHDEGKSTLWRTTLAPFGKNKTEKD